MKSFVLVLAALVVAFLVVQTASACPCGQTVAAIAVERAFHPLATVVGAVEGVCERHHARVEDRQARRAGRHNKQACGACAPAACAPACAIPACGPVTCTPVPKACTPATCDTCMKVATVERVRIIRTRLVRVPTVTACGPAACAPAACAPASCLPAAPVPR